MSWDEFSHKENECRSGGNVKTVLKVTKMMYIEDKFIGYVFLPDQDININKIYKSADLKSNLAVF